jgi:hypothetical protein
MADVHVHRLPRPAATGRPPLACPVAGRALTWLAAFARGGQAHRYTSCRDRDCERLPCLAYREGYSDGHEDGWAEGYAAGRAES